MLISADLDAVFSALADPTRRAILVRLAKGEATVMDLAEPFKVSQPAISRHLKVLGNAGLVFRRTEGTTRPCALSPAALAEVDQWLAALRDVFTANYDRLDRVLAKMKPTDPQPSPTRKRNHAKARTKDRR